ncbi:MAG: T9SS type A sorting domain-containing protein [Taibaiella sp.]|nr:T9SS type A sorting domain-containing protein [Taibaiella sp.]
MLKKVFFCTSIFFLSVGATKSFSQIGGGGFPASFYSKETILQSNILKISDATFEEYISGKRETKNSGAYEVGWSIPANRDLLNDGAWTTLADGSKIFKASISVPNAKALALYYQDFYLPKGVKLFLYNNNKKQILGAFDNTTTDSRIFSNQPIIGDLVHLELNVSNDVDIADIALKLNFIGAYFKGVENESVMYAEDVPLLNDPPIGATASCHVNAMCPQGNAQEEARKATLRIVITGGPGTSMGYCSGTLINNTGNQPNVTCKPLFLTASHCDSENGMSDAHFQYWQFRFNYQMDACTNGNAPTEGSSPTLTAGAKFKSRSYYPTFASTNPESSSLVQDFLLLELNGPLPSGYHLVGWNRATNLTSDPSQSIFYGFHHPSGDVKKLSLGTQISGNGTFNQNTVLSTHWKMVYDIGGTSPGSSGSGLFDSRGLLVGDLSGGATGNCPADSKKFGNDALYSKISYAWENAFDQTEFPAHAGATSRLKDHLDPLNLGLTSLGTTESDNCSDFTSVKVNQVEKLDLYVFPVPSNDGKINIQLNVDKVSDFFASIVDVSGREVKNFIFNNRSSNLKSIDLSQLTNGVYFLTLSSELGQGQYKFVITK